MTGPATSRAAAKAQAQAAIDAATLAFDAGDLDEAAWQRHVSAALARAYLCDECPRWQSGFDGDAALWREAREPILAAVHRDGSFLDVGCATGHLMESLAAWGKERARTLSLYGLELDPALASRARQRLPAWADRIAEGNALEWKPRRQFTFVHTGLEYVFPGRRAELAAGLLDRAVAPGGRLIVGPVSDADLAGTREALVRAEAGPVHAHAATDRNGKTRHVLWVEKPGG